MAEGQSLWSWREVAQWLWENNIIRESEYREAEAIETINVVLDYAYKMKSQTALTREVRSAVGVQKTA